MQLKRILREKEVQLLEQIEQQDRELDDMKGQLIREKRKQMDQCDYYNNEGNNEHAPPNPEDLNYKSDEEVVI